MTIISKAFTLSILAAGGVMISGCGEAIGTDDLANEFAAKCESSFADEGGPAELAKPFCDCSVGKIKEQELGPLDLINQETMTAIGEECMMSVMSDEGMLEEAAPAPAE